VRNYFRIILRRAFTQSLGPIDLWTGLLAAAIGVLDHYLPQAQLMTGYGWQIPIWVLLSVIAMRLLLAPYWIYLEQSGKLTSLEQALRPRLKCSFDMNDPGCVRRNATLATQFRTDSQPNIVQQVQRSVDYYRLKVESDFSGAATDCCGHLVAIKRGAAPLFEGENLLLTFAPAERPDSTAKTICHGIPEYLDFLVIAEGDEVILPTLGFRGPSGISYDQLFSISGDYTLRVVISSSSLNISVPVELIFSWPLARKGAKIVLSPDDLVAR
jgi:hypothetical protein